MMQGIKRLDALNSTLLRHSNYIFNVPYPRDGTTRYARTEMHEFLYPWHTWCYLYWVPVPWG
jgi:hypothetical protein